jgi:hypothetical protein
MHEKQRRALSRFDVVQVNAILGADAGHVRGSSVAGAACFGRHGAARDGRPFQECPIMPRQALAFRVPMRHPGDATAIAGLFDEGALHPQEVVAILGKTEGNGCVNDFTRAYAVSALAAMLGARLGTTPEALEERLAELIELATPWGALLLIDEAEMLLERRARGDVLRNAMVCVMLRLLEYHAGIMFLTTNRVESLDPAFQSRVQCALRYAPLDATARARTWFASSCSRRASRNGSSRSSGRPSVRWHR